MALYEKKGFKRPHTMWVTDKVWQDFNIIRAEAGIKVSQEQVLTMLIETYRNKAVGFLK